MKRAAYIGLGANIEPKTENILKALKYIEDIEGVSITRMSSLYLTSPWGKKNQDDFINQVIEIETELSPVELLHALQDVEIKLGRTRNEKWGPRNIDLDVLMYEGENDYCTEELMLPHPFMMERLFVLIPLQEIQPDLVFPDGSEIGEVLSRVVASDGSQKIRKL